MYIKKLTLITSLILAGCNSSSSSTPLPTLPDYDISGSADGWASHAQDVTGGEGAADEQIYIVTNRAQLLSALYDGKSAPNSNSQPSDEKKIIYVKGSVDLTENADGTPMTPNDFMAQCNTPYQDYDEFYTAYRTQYDPNIWNKQSLIDGKPPEIGDASASDVENNSELALEGYRRCYQKAQASHIVLRVGSNTTIIGVGSDATIQYGQLLLGSTSYNSENVIIRNIHFVDAFDDFPNWEPTDAFSVDSSEFGTGNCSATFESEQINPNGCESIKGGRWNSEYDLLNLNNAQRIWIDHNTLSDGARTDDNYPGVFAAPYNTKEQKVQHHDGLIDITNGSTQITVSYNHFKDHDKTNLLGGSDSVNTGRNYGPGAIDVTFHNNHWENVGQRLPRVRFGRVHLFNNYYNLKGDSNYSMGEAIILGTAAKIFAENNAFEISASSDLREKIIGFKSTQSNKEKCMASFNKEECSTHFYAHGNTLDGQSLNLITIAQTHAESSSGNTQLYITDAGDSSSYWRPEDTYDYELQAAAQVKNHVLNNAGAGKLETE